jgi:hypothetical protein
MFPVGYDDRMMFSAVRRMAHVLSAGACLALFACATSTVPPDAAVNLATSAAPKVEVVQHREEFELGKEISRVVIDNPHGDVRVRSFSEQSLGLFAVIQRIGEAPLDPEFVVARSDGALTLTVRYAGEAGWLAGDHQHGRADLGVWLPKGVQLDVRSTDGSVQISHWNRDVRVSTLSGRIQVSGKAGLDLESSSGAIVARQTSGRWDGIARVVSGSGSILAAVPAFADVHLLAHSGTTLSVDPGLPVATATDSGGMDLESSFGAASHRLEIRSGGSVHLVPVLR